MEGSAQPKEKDKILLAYSGGLDTSVAIHWLKEKYGCDVVAVTIDVGQSDDLKDAMRRAKAIGASRSWVIDAKKEFVEEYVLPALKANALYEGNYPLGTAIARPLMVKKLVNMAKKLECGAIAHGCTGKGNDQVRFEVSIMALAPEMNIIAPTRDWKMSREEEISYANEHGIPVPVSVEAPYSIDESIWSRAIECGVLEDAWIEPPEDIFEWTKGSGKSPDHAEYIEIGFYHGKPVSLNGAQMPLLDLIYKLNEIAGNHGVGRIDHIENRLVGIKSREVYEAPAATVLIKAHQDLESLVMTKDLLHYKKVVEQHYADLVYNGLWFSPLKEALDVFIEKTQELVTGTVKLKLFKGSAVVVGRESTFSLYNTSLSTYDKGDAFDHSAAKGFIYVWGLPLKVASQVKASANGNGATNEVAVSEESVTVSK
ncbi:MAG: argininosuccinate synthase [Euryarchaeota archaeon RBG_16_62_10]|nr:MAG: argininosuccinate synthase [Euryarchaeota archaeon RBG_16_62_10]